ENSTLVPSVSSSSYGRVDLAWTATWDRDNANLTYTVLRDGTAVGSVTQASSFWQLPTVTYTDKGLTPGTVHTYRIRASDPFGNTVGSGASSSVTVMGGTPPPDDAPTAAFTSGCTQLSCTFDGTGSTDPDGSITSYAWDFADGTTATGATPSHTFTTGGTHFVTLTVTADSGATDIATHAVDTNAPPVAAFTSACTRLKCTFDASTSTDSDGKVESYFWDLGDETTSTKKKLTHMYAIGGTHMVSLTVSDNSGATDTVTRAVTTNAPPLARFTASCSTSTCSFDASASSDPGGSIASYAWTFGDGARGSGVRPSHTYGTSGSHTVTLTVTDDGGAATAVSHAVTTSAQVWASDAFSRTVKSGWGSAHVGGAWSDRGCASLSVTGGYGRLVGRRGATCSAWLPHVARSSTDTTATLSVPSVPRAGMQISVLGRRISASSDIRLQLSLARGGTVKAALLGVVGSNHTALSPTKTLPLPSSAHGRLHVELVVTGTSPTVVRAKVWADGKAEPSGWTVKGQSSRAMLQHSGSVGVATLLHGGTGSPATAQLRVLGLRSQRAVG
ncbi:PKD domain-containing protein, partial [Jatrophihabitans endophyticus]|uniref:PKD domain-containing protein n=1 Tax=Jatrophihabitans endophyticus TaxID=1206085 RepID=UPI0019F5BAB9